MDPSKKAKYNHGQTKLTSMSEVKEWLSENLDIEVADVGYISPGHRMKGKKNLSEDDIRDMYAEYSGKRNILLWCYSRVQDVPKKQVGAERTRASSTEEGKGEPATKSKRDINQHKLKEIEDIIAKLKENHGSAYKVGVLNAWAHMIQMGKHSSYEDPPNYPYFGRKHPKKAAASDDGESSSQGSVLGSPGKRIHLRSECCLLYTSPSPRDATLSRMPSSA